MMGLLHDVGKIGVPDTVINKPGKLTDEEFAMIKKHLVKGAEILATVSEMPGIPCMSEGRYSLIQNVRKKNAHFS